MVGGGRGIGCVWHAGPVVFSGEWSWIDEVTWVGIIPIYFLILRTF